MQRGVPTETSAALTARLCTPSSHKGSHAARLRAGPADVSATAVEACMPLLCPLCMNRDRTGRTHMHAVAVHMHAVAVAWARWGGPAVVRLQCSRSSPCCPRRRLCCCHTPTPMLTARAQHACTEHPPSIAAVIRCDRYTHMHASSV